MDIIHDIGIWIIGLEYSDKLKDNEKLIKSLRNSVLRMRAYNNWEHYLYFGTFFSIKQTNTNGRAEIKYKYHAVLY